MESKIQENKYDLVEWVADMICKYHVLCKHCMFLRDDKCVDCHNKNKVIKELIKKYNL